MSAFAALRALQRQTSALKFSHASTTVSSACSKIGAPAVAFTTLLDHGPAMTTSLRGVRSFSSKNTTYTSPLDELLDPDPDAVCPLLGTPRSVPFLKPKRNILECGLAEDKLKFKTVNYGKRLDAPFIHQNEHKIVVFANLDDLPLDDLGKQILLQAIGPQRYNMKKNEMKMSCIYFPSRIENKRYLVHMLDKLLCSCQRLAKSVPPEGEPRTPRFVPGPDEEKAVLLGPPKPSGILGSTERSMGGFKKWRSR